VTKSSFARLHDPISAVEAFCSAIIQGDVEGIADAHIEGGVAIIDSVAPFFWCGATAVTDWMESMTLHVEQHGIRDGCVVYEAPVVNFTDGEQAYAVIPSTWSYEAKGVEMRDVATIAFALRRTSTGWRVAGWARNASN
jgi:hypothetical protein